MSAHLSRLLCAVLVIVVQWSRGIDCERHSEAFFDGSSQVLLPNATLWPQMTLAFRACGPGVLVSQGQDNNGAANHTALSLLPSGALELRWGRDTMHIGANYADNRWHRVSLNYAQGALELRVDGGTPRTVADTTLRPHVLGGAVAVGVVVGENLVGCLQEGIGVVFGPDAIAQGARWGPCPLPDVGHCDGYKTDPCWSHACHHGGVCSSDNGKPRCQCTARFSGDHCELDGGSLCQRSDAPSCANGGSCREDWLGNKSWCACPPQWEGPLCTTPAEDAQCAKGRPCLNGGTCLFSSVCQCPNGFAGRHCELDVNECQLSPCRNNGTCTQGLSGHLCNCQGTGFKGPQCETDVDECTEGFSACFGSAPCFNRHGGFECACEPGYTGPRCEERLKPCDGLCFNGATCTASSTCLCAKGFTGPRCQTPDYCSGGCPQNARCVGGRQCVCQPGYWGPLCDRAQSCAESPCRLGSTCVNISGGGYQCHCPPEWSGDHCHLASQPCKASPCRNGATCVEDQTTYACLCLPGFSGAQCEVQDDKCASSPCSNGGTCTNLVDDFVCICPKGWEGKQCELMTDNCLGHPCQQGTCVNGLASFTCSCLQGYTGARCEADVDDCAAAPCLNGGTCQDALRGYACQCSPPFTGRHCERDACSSSPCLNNATCLALSSGFQCVCNPGFTGTFCETNVDECPGACPDDLRCFDRVNSYQCKCLGNCSEPRCSSNPCHGGATCREVPGGVECECKKGWTGPRCERDVDECQAGLCQNKAFCQNLNGSYQCYCRPGFTGTHCNIEVNECLSQPCQNGATCREGVNHYDCLCQPGYEGKHCELDINECASAPCLHGATCEDQVNNFQCLCPPGYEGSRCEMDVDECQSNPCLNGAPCLDKVNGYECNCTDTGFEGTHCEHNINDCYEGACLHGGTCQDKVKGFTCLCHVGYDGDACERDIPECLSTPCQSGAPCLERSNISLYLNNYLSLFPGPFSYATAGGYVCVCPSGFNGTNCENNIDDCVDHDCTHGKCIDLVNAYRCDCDPGYEGVKCAVEVDECQRHTPCRNGATCVDLVADYRCTCPPLYGDKNCSTELLGCLNDPCHNGATCEPLLDTQKNHVFHCHCLLGFSGERCDIQTTSSFATGSTWRVTFRPERLKEQRLEFYFRTTLADITLVLLTLNKLESLSGVLRNGSFHLVRGQPASQSLLIVGSHLNDSDWKRVTVVLSSKSVVVNVSGKGASAELVHRSSDTVLLSSVTFGDGRLVGCLQEVKVNKVLMLPGDKKQAEGQRNITVGCSREEQCLRDTCRNDGLCVDLWDQFKCHCNRPFFGDRCNQSFPAATFGHQGKLSYTKLKVLDSAALEKSLDVSLFLRTRKSTGLVFYLGPETGSFKEAQGAFLAVQLHGGAVRVIIGSQVAGDLIQVTLPTKVDDGELHFLQVEVQGGKLRAAVDRQWQEKGIPPSKKLVPLVLYLGWLPTERPALRRRRQVPSVWLGPVASAHGNVDHFKGVLQDLMLNGQRVGLSNETEGEPNSLVQPESSKDVLAGQQSDDECSSDPCKNGATCTDIWNDYRCECTAQYRGKYCTELKPCVNNSCPQQSICQDLTEGYECVSSATFDGNRTGPFQYKAALQTNKSLDSVKLQFRSRTPGVLLYTSRGDSFLSVTLKPPLVEVRWLFRGGSEQNMSLSLNQDFGNWSSLEVHVNDTNITAILQPATRQEMIRKDPGFESLRDIVADPLNSHIWLGSGPDGDGAFKGCLQEVRLGGILLPLFVSSTLGNTTMAVPDRFELEGDAEPSADCTLCREWDCHNGGRCSDPGTQYGCECSSSFEGDFCEKDVDECAAGKGPCQNGATCLNMMGSYRCICADGYTGRHCEERIWYCDFSPCENGATCLDTEPGSYNCRCSEDFEGQNCTERKIITCAQAPCQNDGVCLSRDPPDGRISYRCECDPAYEGLNCENERNFCTSQPCLNGAECRRERGGFSCICVSGYRGTFCQEMIDFCLDRPCLHGGRCKPLVADYECDCRNTGYEGKSCQIDVDECVESPCQAGGVCSNTEGSYLCLCPPERFGVNCQLNNTCHLESPCHNGAVCTPMEDPPFFCNCTPGYHGDTCALLVSSSSLDSTDLKLVIGLTVACVFLMAFIAFATVFLRMAKKKRATRGTYSPSNQEMFGSRVEMNPVMKPPPEERLI